MGVPPTGGSDDRGGITGGGDLRLPPPEHSHTFHCEEAHYVPVYGLVSASGVKDVQAVLGRGRLGLGRDADGGLGGGTDRGGGGR